MTASAAYVDGRLHRFTVAARHAGDGKLVGTGEVTRVVVDAERFLCRALRLTDRRPAAPIMELGHPTAHERSDPSGPARRGARRPNSTLSKRSGVGALAVVRCLLATRAALAAGLAHGVLLDRMLGAVSQTSARRRESEPRQPSVIRIWTSRICTSTRCRSSVGRRLGAGPGDDRLDGALEVVLLQARAALVEVDPDGRAVGLVELVVEEVDDPLEVVGALVARLWSWLTTRLPSRADRQQVVGRARSPRACRAAGAGRGAAGTSRCRSGCP